MTHLRGLQNASTRHRPTSTVNYEPFKRLSEMYIIKQTFFLQIQPQHHNKIYLPTGSMYKTRSIRAIESSCCCILFNLKNYIRTGCSWLVHVIIQQAHGHSFLLLRIGIMFLKSWKLCSSHYQCHQLVIIMMKVDVHSMYTKLLVLMHFIKRYECQNE